jgi:hypothetical protein
VGACLTAPRHSFDCWQDSIADDGVGNVLYGTVAEMPRSYQCAEFSTVLSRDALLGGVASSFSIRDSCLVESVRIGISGKAWHEFHPEKRTAKVIDTTICFLILQGRARFLVRQMDQEVAKARPLNQKDPLCLITKRRRDLAVLSTNVAFAKSN